MQQHKIEWGYWINDEESLFVQNKSTEMTYRLGEVPNRIHGISTLTPIFFRDTPPFKPLDLEAAVYLTGKYQIDFERVPENNSSFKDECTLRDYLKALFENED